MSTKLKPKSEWAKFLAEGKEAGKTMDLIRTEWREKKTEPRLTPPSDQGSAEVSESGEHEDYLRQYQVRKQTIPGSIASDPPVGSKAERQKKFYLASPIVEMIFPRKDGEDKSHTQTLNVNGYHLEFPKQRYVIVPKPAADILKDSLGQTEMALERDRIDSSTGSHSQKEKEFALGL